MPKSLEMLKKEEKVLMTCADKTKKEWEDLKEKSEKSSHVTKDIVEQKAYEFYRQKQELEKCKKEIQEIQERLKSEQGERERRLAESAELERITSQVVLPVESTRTKNEKKANQMVPKVGHSDKKKYQITPSQSWHPLIGLGQTLLYTFFCNNCQIEEEQLRSAAYAGNISKIKYSIENGVNVNGRGLVSSVCSIAQGFFDKTPLMLAAKAGQLDCVEILIKANAAVNLLDSNAWSALDYALLNQHEDIVELLYKNGGKAYQGDLCQHKIEPKS